MEQVVYIDVLVVVNYLITWLLLLAAAKLSGRRLQTRRAVYASLLGGASSLLIFLPVLPTIWTLLLKLLLTVLLVLTAFGYSTGRRLARDVTILFAVSFFTGGLVLAVILAVPNDLLYYRNGVVYCNISAGLLLAMTTLAYLVVSACNRIFRSRLFPAYQYQLTVGLGEKSVLLYALCDTGNRLTEPFSGWPVIVCEYEKIRPLLPQEAHGVFGSGDCETLPDDFIGRFRMVSCKGIGKATVLPAFVPDLVTIRGKDFTGRTRDVYIGVTTERLGGEYAALLNPQLLCESSAEKEGSVC